MTKVLLANHCVFGLRSMSQGRNMYYTKEDNKIKLRRRFLVRKIHLQTIHTALSESIFDWLTKILLQSFWFRYCTNENYDCIGSNNFKIYRSDNEIRYKQKLTRFAVSPLWLLNKKDSSEAHPDMGRLLVDLLFRI